MIYLDHNATSVLLPEAQRAMEPWLGVPCNPSSAHGPGRAAAAAVERAREQVAALVGKDPRLVVFTSGATEANHAWFQAHRDRHVGVGATEHPSVHAAALRAASFEVIPVGNDGRVEQLPDLDCISLMAANHETGVVHTEIGRVQHVDATAAAGRMPLELQADVTLSAHKIGGPMGIGALIGDVDGLFSGSQQRGRRAGTVNTPAAVGFGVAAALALSELSARRERWLALQERLLQAVAARGGRVVGPPQLPTVVNAVFPGLPAEMVVTALDLRGVCVSAGAACASGSVDHSPVLEAMGDPEPDGGVRFSLGWNTTTAQIEGAIERLDRVLDDLEPLRT